MSAISKDVVPSKDGITRDKPRILVVDDSRVIRRAIGKILSAEFDLIEAEDGEAGWELLMASDDIRAVVSDVEMPRLDGHALLKRIRSAEPTRVRNVPVIMVTGAEDEPAKERAYAFGATDFITKPIDGVQLLARAHAHVRFGQTTRKLEETSEALEQKAMLDPLTQLHNRRFFVERCTQTLALADRHDTDVCIVRVDVDRFKDILLKYGDHVADAVLVRMAQIVARRTRREETAARVGGAEFAVLAPMANRVEAMVLGERLRASAETEIFAHAGTRIPLTISVGLASRGEGPDVEALLALAQRRLTVARSAGGNRVNVGQIQEVPKTQPALSAVTMPSLLPQATREIVASTPPPSVETALSMLKQGDSAALEPFLPALTVSVLPLLEACNQQLGLGLSFAIESLKEKLRDIDNGKRITL